LKCAAKEPPPNPKLLQRYFFYCIPLLIIPFLPSPKYWVPGGLSASLSHTLTVPIDVIKTKQQIDEVNYVHSKYTTEPEKYKNAHHSYTIFKTAKRLIEKEGPFILLAGTAPTAIGYFLEGSLKFGSYELMKSLNYSYFMSGLVSGILASIILCPMEALRIRLVSKPNFATSSTKGLAKMISSEGPLSLFKGLTAMLSKQVPYTIVKQVSFDLFRTHTSYIPIILSAFLSSILSTLSSHPGDMLLSSVNSSASSRKCRVYMKEIYERDGFKGFFTGLNARFVHIGVIVTVQLVVYDMFKNYFGV